MEPNKYNFKNLAKLETAIKPSSVLARVINHCRRIHINSYLFFCVLLYNYAVVISL